MLKSSLTQRPAWKALQAHYPKIQSLHLRKLFADDPQRGRQLTAEAIGIYFDYSKNRITDETVKLLVQLAEESDLRNKIDAMFRGDKINITENRSVLHVALRMPRGQALNLDGEDVVPKVHAVLDRMAKLADQLRSGSWKGHTGKAIRNIVNIGIGGSDLGPVMAYEALRHYSAVFDRSFHLQHRRHRLRRGYPRSRCRGDDVHYLLEDFYHSGNDDQCPYRARLDDEVDER